MVGEVCGFLVRQGRGDRPVEEDRRVGLWQCVRVDREAGDPLAVGEREGRRGRVGNAVVVALVGPVLQGPTSVVLISGGGVDLEAVGADHCRGVAGAARGLGILGGPRAGGRVVPAEVQGRVARVCGT